MIAGLASLVCLMTLFSIGRGNTAIRTPQHAAGEYAFPYKTGEVEVLSLKDDCTQRQEFFQSPQASQDSVPPAYAKGGAWSCTDNLVNTERWLMYCDWPVTGSACDGDLCLRLIARQHSLPCSSEKLQFCSGWLICGAFGVGGGLLACVSDESDDGANNGDDMSEWFHAIKCPPAGWAGCQEFVKRFNIIRSRVHARAQRLTIQVIPRTLRTPHARLSGTTTPTRQTASRKTHSRQTPAIQAVSRW